MLLTTAAAARVLGVDRKTLDNILVREAHHLVAAGRRGQSRRIAVEVLERIAIALVLRRDLDIPLTRGLTLADALAAKPGQDLSIGSLGLLRFDVQCLRAALATSTSQVLEEVAPPPRGRPPASGHKTRRGAS